MTIHVFIKIFLKIIPLLEELLLKDKTFVEFFFENKLAFFLLTIIVILSLSLYNVRNKVLTNPIKTKSDIEASTLLEGLVTKNLEDPQPPKRPSEPSTTKPDLLVREDEEIRQLIRRQLIE